MNAKTFDDTPCELGEGPLWHPKRKALFWFDVLGKSMFVREGATQRKYNFDEMASAAGWVDDTTLLVASETALYSLDLDSEALTHLCPLEADNPINRSNDGRADPWGGFWIGTMGKNAEDEAGAIYRYYKGELRQLYASITISNAISFEPSGTFACFTDTKTRKIMRQNLSDKEGWPVGDPEIYLDFTGETWGPDGAVFDAAGNFWNAQWGASRIACYDPSGKMLTSVAFPAPHTSCPAFGGEDLTSLFCTTARQGMSQADLAGKPLSGMTFVAENVVKGQAEHQVIL